MQAKELKTVFLFDSFEDEELSQIAQIAKESRYTKDSILFYEGEFAKKLYILTSGILSVNKMDTKGKEVEIHRFAPTTLIAEMATFDERNFPATARFLSEGSAIEIEYQPLKQILMSDTKLLFAVTKSLCNKIRSLEQTITYQLTLDSTARVAKFLLDHPKEAASMKHSEIASRLNIAPETLSRIFKKLRESLFITQETKNFQIIDKNGLEAIASGDN